MAAERALPSVDVVVPCYNYARYLEGCLKSVLSQRDVSVRVLIIDDQSPDNTPEVARRLAAADDRIEYVRNEKNLGLIGSANRGIIDWARSDYVMLLSADDVLTPGALARATQLMEDRPEVGLVYGMALMLWDDGPELQYEDVKTPRIQVLDGADCIRRIFEHGNFVPTPSAILRTSVQHRIGGYDARFKYTSDVNMWLRASAAGSVGVIDAVQSLYRWHASNMSSASQRRPLGDRREVLETCRDFVRSHGQGSEQMAAMLRATERRMCREALIVANETFGEQEAVSRDAAAFAREADSLFFLSPLWAKLQLRRVLGPRLSSALRSARQSLRNQSSDNRAWYEHGMKIGWWPQP